MLFYGSLPGSVHAFHDSHAFFVLQNLFGFLAAATIVSSRSNDRNS
jgi:hypothetical protein